MAEGSIASLRLGALAIPGLGGGRREECRQQTEKREEDDAADRGTGQRTRQALRGGGDRYSSWLGVDMEQVTPYHQQRWTNIGCRA